MASADPSLEEIPALPQFLWDVIVEALFASEPAWPAPRALAQLGSLARTCRALRAACAAATWNVDATGALDAHIAALAAAPPQPAAASLALGDFSNREWALRSPPFVDRSGSCLRALTASVHCTDTLQRFPNIETLTLYASEFFNRLYPAVLAGLPALRSLELVDYVMKEPLTAAVPPQVLARLKTLTVRHLPYVGAAWPLDSKREPRFRASLESLIISGSFDRIQAANYSPPPSLALRDVLRAATAVRIEGSVLEIWDPEAPRITAAWVARALAARGGRWRTLEVRLLEQIVTAPGTMPPMFSLRLVDLALWEMQPWTREGLEWEYTEREEGIFVVYSLRAWRRGPGGEGARQKS